MQQNSKKELLITLAVLLVVVLVVGGAIAFTKHKPSNVIATSQNTDTGSNINSSSTSTSSDASYSNGTYTATGHYVSPGGEEGITVTVTLTNNIVTNTSAQSGANDGTAAEYQADFLSGYKPLVVGKNINDIHLSRVSGSSLTSQGFNDAIQQIESQAKA